MRNLGTKKVTYITTEGNIQSTTFQIGDNITRPLYAVSQICSSGKCVFFGPGPKFESFIVHDPEAFLVHNGTATSIHMNSGVYELDVKEVLPGYQPYPKLASIDDEAEASAEPEVSMQEAPAPQNGTEARARSWSWSRTLA